MAVYRGLGVIRYCSNRRGHRAEVEFYECLPSMGIRLRISMAHAFLFPLVQCMARLPGLLKTRSHRSQAHRFFDCTQPFLAQ